MVIRYVKEVGKFSYEQGKGYSDEGIDLRSVEYFRMLREGNLNMPVAGIRDDLYVRRNPPYQQHPKQWPSNQYALQRASTRYSSTCEYQ